MTVAQQDTARAANLARLIQRIDDRLTAIGRCPDCGDPVIWRSHYAEYRVLLGELVINEGARYRKGRGGRPASIVLAGICTSCTAGDYGLLLNWRRRAVQMCERLASRPAS